LMQLFSVALNAFDNYVPLPEHAATFFPISR